jgi:hypothetical protein
MTANLVTIDRGRLEALTERERSAYLARFPASREASGAAADHLFAAAADELLG